MSLSAGRGGSSGQSAMMLRWLGIIVICLLLIAGCGAGEDEVATPVRTAVPPSPTATMLPPTQVPAAQPTPSLPEGPWPPVVVDYQPRPGAAVSPDAPLTWTFDQPVKPESFSNALRIDPMPEGALVWENAQTAVFQPSFLSPGTTYDVVLGAGVQSETGLMLTEALAYSFTALSPLRVTHTVPPAGATDLRSDAVVALSFNYPVVPANCVGRLDAPPDLCPPLPLGFNPDVMGAGRWVNTSRYEFEALTGFAAGRAYEVTLDADVTSIVGAVLAEPYTWSFEMALPQVTQVTPAPGSSDVPIDADIVVEFSTPMDQEITASELLVTDPAGEVVPGSMTWFDNGTRLSFMPLTSLALDSVYQVQLGTRSRAVSSAPLTEVEPWAFRTVPSPGLVSFAPDDGAEDIGLHAPVRLTFDGAIAEASLRAGVQVTSAQGVVEDVFKLYDGASGVTTVMWEREPRTDYCVTLSSDIRDLYGNSLVDGERFCFETGDRPPMLAPLPGYGAISLDAGRPSVVSFLAQNVGEVAFSLADAEITALMQQPSLQGEALRSWDEILETPPNTVSQVGVYLRRLKGALPPGVYVLSWQEPGSAISVQTLPIAVVDRHVMVKRSHDEALVWVTDLATGTPISKTEVQLLDREGLLVAGGTTDIDGLARLPIGDAEDRPLWETLAAVTGRPESAGFGVALTTWQGDAPEQGKRIEVDLGPKLQQRVYLLTDRPIYRPGQVIEVAGLVREAVDEGYQLPQTAFTGTLSLRGADGGVVDALDVQVTPNGRFDARVVLPETLNAGDYTLAFASGTGSEMVGRASTELGLRIDAYHEPYYSVTVTPRRRAVLDGETVAIDLRAATFTGRAVAGADVRWRIIAEPYHFGPTDDSTRDSEGWIWQAADAHVNERLVAEGEGRTDAAGSLLITEAAELTVPDGAKTTVSEQWHIEVVVSETDGSPVLGSGDVTVHAAETYVGLRPEAWAVRSKERLSVDLMVVDWDGVGKAGLEIALDLARRTWYHDAMAATWGYTDTVISEQRVVAGPDGMANVAFTAPRSGSYVVKAEVLDGPETAATNSLTFWVGGGDVGGWQRTPTTLDLVPNAQSYQVGDVAEVLIPLDAAGSYQVLVTLERDALLSVGRYEFSEANPILEIPILPTHAPNVYLSCVAVQSSTADLPAQVAVGRVRLPVTPVQQFLDVDLWTDELRYEPGDTVDLTVRTMTADGQPIPADVTLAVVDRAVLSLADDASVSLREVFYGERPLRVMTGDSLLASGDLTADVLAQLLDTQAAAGTGPAGMGGMMPSSSPVGEVEARHNFADTAYWTSNLQTDDSGTGQVAFTLPDSITSWEVRAWAITPETAVGEATTQLTVTKPLLVRPITPSYLVAGDVTQITGLIENNTPEALDVRVVLTVETGLTLDGPSVKEIRVEPDGMRRVTWPVTVMDTPVQAAEFYLSAESGGYSDAGRVCHGHDGAVGVPIYPIAPPDVVGFSGQVLPGERSVESFYLPEYGASEASMSLTLNPSPVTLLVDALTFVPGVDATVRTWVDEILPAVVSHQVLAELDTAGEIRAKTREDVGDVLTRICAQQHADGGWGWWPRQSNLHLTSYVTFALLRAADAGFPVSDRALTAALSYVAETLTKGVDAGLRYPHFALALRILSEADRPWPQGVGSVLYADRQSLGLAGRAHLALAYALVDPSDTRVTTLLGEVSAMSVESGTTLHWTETDSQAWSTSVQVTALIVDVLSRIDPETPDIEPAVAWLLHARQGAGWETSYETAWSLVAIASTLRLRGGLGGSGLPEVHVNGLAVAPAAEAGDGVGDAGSRVVSIDGRIDDGVLRGGVNVVEIVQDWEADAQLAYAGVLHMPVSRDLAGQPQRRGLAVARRYCRVDETGDGGTASAPDACRDVVSVMAGEWVEVRLTVTVPETRYFVRLDVPHPAGFVGEPVSDRFDTRWAMPIAMQEDAVSADQDLGALLRLLDLGERKATYLAEVLPPGTYEVAYKLRATTPGLYNVPAATVYETYLPEVNGRTQADRIQVVAEVAE